MKTISLRQNASEINSMTGSNKMKEGDKNKLTRKAPKNNSRLYERVAAANAACQKTKNSIIVRIVKMIFLALLRFELSFIR